jgi:hypothetical protein
LGQRSCPPLADEPAAPTLVLDKPAPAAPRTIPAPPRTAACPTCDYRPTDARKLELRRDGLATIWLTLAPDQPKQIIDGLTGGRIMDAANFSAVFIAATMAPPGIEPPLELR